MTEEEYIKLKAKLTAEELRRRKIASLEDKINDWKNNLGLVKPSGWTSNMKIIINQQCMISYS